MNVTRGLPRITELVDVAKTIKMPVTTVYLRDPTKTEEFVKRLPGVPLNVVVRRRYLERPGQAPPPEHQRTIDLYRLVFDDDVQADLARGGSGVVLVLELDGPTMHQHGLVPQDVKRAADRLYNAGALRMLEVMASDSSDPVWWVRVRMLGDICQMRERMPAEHADQLEQHVVQRVGDFLVESTLVSGVTGVTGASVREVSSKRPDPTTGDARDTTVSVVDAAGRALAQILTMPGVDVDRTTSNDVPEVHAVLGIEAAAQCLAEELAQTLGYDGRYINARHITTVVNTMTCRGFLMQLSRHGINRVETGPLVRCSFEETVDTLFDAAIFGEYDDVTGVTPNIMLGQRCPVGTGVVDVLEPPASQLGRRSRTTVVCSRMTVAPEPATGSPGLTGPTGGAVLSDPRRRVVHSRMSYQLRVDEAAGVIRSLAMCCDDGPNNKRARRDDAAPQSRGDAMVASDAMDLPFLSGGPAPAWDAPLHPLGSGIQPEPIVAPAVRQAPAFIRGRRTFAAFLHGG